MGYKGWGYAFIGVAFFIALAAGMNTDEPPTVGYIGAVVVALIGAGLWLKGHSEERRP